jgi:hypothetical protein
MLATTLAAVDAESCAVGIQTLKRRKTGLIRHVPLPPKLLDELEQVFRFGIAITDAEDDGLIRGEGSDEERECGPDDYPCDEQVGPASEIGTTGPTISNANSAFSVVD